MTSVRATNPAQITSMRTAEVVKAQRGPSGSSDVRDRGGVAQARAKAPSDTAKTGTAPHSLPDCPLPAVVVNPIHIDDLAQLHAQIATVCAELGWAPPLWL